MITSQLFKLLILFPIIAFLAIVLVKCQENPTSVVPENQSVLTFYKFSLPAGAELVSAEFFINLEDNNDQTIKIHRVTAPSEEMIITWNNLGSAFDGGIIEGSFVSDLPLGYKSVDVFDLVNAWLSGTVSKYGLLLDQVDLTLFSTFENQENY